MSTFFQETKHPETGKWEKATWHDDYFGSHLYGIEFPSDNKVFDPREHDLETRQATDDGKVVETKEHASGRKDVNISVNMIDVKGDDPATSKAREHINEVVIPALANADVLVVVLHKPTNVHAEKIVKAPHVRAYAEAVFESYNNGLVKEHGIEGLEAPSDEFVIIEHHITNSTVNISTL